MYKRGGLFCPRSLAVDRVLEELTTLLDLWLPGEPCEIKQVNSSGSSYALWTASEFHGMKLPEELLLFITKSRHP